MGPESGRLDAPAEPAAQRERQQARHRRLDRVCDLEELDDAPEQKEVDAVPQIDLGLRDRAERAAGGAGLELALGAFGQGSGLGEVAGVEPGQDRGLLEAGVAALEEALAGRAQFGEGCTAERLCRPRGADSGAARRSFRQLFAPPDRTCWHSYGIERPATAFRVLPFRDEAKRSSSDRCGSSSS